MAQSQTQFSPAQIFDIARRAEADGRYDQALQFYRHLVEHFGGSPEARAAQEAAIRLSQQQPSNLNGMHENGLNGLNGASHTATTQPPVGGRTLGQTHETAGPLHPPSYAPSSPQPTNGAPASRRQGRLQLQPVAGADSSDRPTKPADTKQRSYIIGRIFSWLTVGLGAVSLASGCGLFAAVFIAPRIVGAVSGSGSLISGAASAFSVIVLGVLLVLAGLTARAVFNNARAIQNLASLEQFRHSGRRPQ